MAQTVKVGETVCVAGVNATQRIVEAVTMVTFASVTMNTVRSFRTNCVEGMVSVIVADANALQAMRAQLVSARCLRRAVVLLTTRCATTEGFASVTAVNAMRDTSVHNARIVLAALIHARPNCTALNA